MKMDDIFLKHFGVFSNSQSDCRVFSSAWKVFRTSTTGNDLYQRILKFENSIFERFRSSLEIRRSFPQLHFLSRKLFAGSNFCSDFDWPLKSSAIARAQKMNRIFFKDHKKILILKKSVALFRKKSVIFFDSKPYQVLHGIIKGICTVIQGK